MSLKEYIDVISKSEIFKSASSDTLIQTLNEIKFRIAHYDANSIIFDEDNICTTFNIVLDGIVGVQKKDKSGNLLENVLVKTSDIFGESIFLTTRIYLLSLHLPRNT
ncbi:hypothetical protein [Petroclostridium xylanilyticum]|uniref:hypothetical protein n=1 Tax=Petroclostridium xylanilyticum TaxID=1792311 RepID=UPI000B9950B7|nr:hypothetical protein [Petroclostridium xylanilyticum]